MSRGRPRLLDTTMPAHIEPARLPKRCYWDGRDRVWYTIHAAPKPKRQRIADAKATLADLHRIMEGFAGIERGTVGYVLDQFHESKKFQTLAPSTQAGYEKLRRVTRRTRTKVGTVDKLVVARLTVEFMQVLLDRIAQDTPTTANHLLRYWRRSFVWGIQRGCCATNPCRGVEQAKERKLRRLPDPAVVVSLLRFTQARGDVALRREGACAPYLWAVIELAYLLRLRGIEVLMLSDASAGDEGVRVVRTKGSRDNVVRWSPRLRAAWDAAVALRTKTWERTRTPVPLRAVDRPLLVSVKGSRLRKGTLDSAWQQMIHLAMRENVITAAQRFALHDLKRRGITDTAGTRGEKQVASGHKSEQMLEVYDFSLPVVAPAGDGS